MNEEYQKMEHGDNMESKVGPPVLVYTTSSTTEEKNPERVGSGLDRKPHSCFNLGDLMLCNKQVQPLLNPSLSFSSLSFPPSSPLPVSFLPQLHLSLSSSSILLNRSQPCMYSHLQSSRLIVLFRT